MIPRPVRLRRPREGSGEQNSREEQDLERTARDLVKVN
jgi:hypothetical protein